MLANGTLVKRSVSFVTYQELNGTGRVIQRFSKSYGQTKWFLKSVIIIKARSCASKLTVTFDADRDRVELWWD